MVSKSIIVCLSLILAGALQAQTPPLPPEFASLPDEIKNLKWQTIDLNAAPALERCRSLLMMNHVLDEVSANATAEADLMSTFIEKQNLGQQFAQALPPPPAKQLSFEDAQKITIALLRGPMSKSFYATELADSAESGLAAYEQMYMRTCSRRWSEIDEARHQVRAMASFLGNSQKMGDYESWANAETALRQKQYEQHLAANPAQQRAQQADPALVQENNQLRQALAVSEAQQQAQAQQTAQAQEQTAAAQQQAANAQQQAAQGQQPYASPYVPTYGVYGGYGAYGAYAAYAAGAYTANAVNTANAENAANTAKNANAANAAKNANAANTAQQGAHSQAAAAAAGQYHGANSSWNRDSNYNSAARSQTDQRMSSFHGTAGAGGGRRR